jgi:transcriptional regulator with GAF, ATPase, and Fis domain
LRKGKFELAHESTLFLDEVGDLPLDTQARILRATETREIERLGGSRRIAVDVRFLCATNKDLTEEMKRGRFREDLYHRINVTRIHIPPLRERREDIPALANHFLFALARRYGRPPKGISEEGLELLKSQPWPGNVRELRHVIEGLIFRVRGDTISSDDIRAALPLANSAAGLAVSLPPGGIALEEIQRQAVLQALEQAAWVQKDAAELLGISPDQMNTRIRKYGITHAAWKTHRG